MSWFWFLVYGAFTCQVNGPFYSMAACNTELIAVNRDVEHASVCWPSSLDPSAVWNYGLIYASARTPVEGAVTCGIGPFDDIGLCDIIRQTVAATTGSLSQPCHPDTPPVLP